MGATTFVAVAGPADACMALAGTHHPPVNVGNRRTNKIKIKHKTEQQKQKHNKHIKQT